MKNKGLDIPPQYKVIIVVSILAFFLVLYLVGGGSKTFKMYKPSGNVTEASDDEEQLIDIEYSDEFLKDISGGYAGAPKLVASDDNVFFIPPEYCDGDYLRNFRVIGVNQSRAEAKTIKKGDETIDQYTGAVVLYGFQTTYREDYGKDYNFTKPPYDLNMTYDTSNSYFANMMKDATSVASGDGVVSINDYNAEYSDEPPKVDPKDIETKINPEAVDDTNFRVATVVMEHEIGKDQCKILFCDPDSATVNKLGMGKYNLVTNVNDDALSVCYNDKLYVYHFDETNKTYAASERYCYSLDEFYDSSTYRNTLQKVGLATATYDLSMDITYDSSSERWVNNYMKNLKTHFDYKFDQESNIYDYFSNIISDKVEKEEIGTKFFNDKDGVRKKVLTETQNAYNGYRKTVSGWASSNNYSDVPDSSFGDFKFTRGTNNSTWTLENDMQFKLSEKSWILFVPVTYTEYVNGHVKLTITPHFNVDDNYDMSINDLILTQDSITYKNVAETADDLLEQGKLTQDERNDVRSYFYNLFKSWTTKPAKYDEVENTKIPKKIDYSIIMQMIVTPKSAQADSEPEGLAPDELANAARSYPSNIKQHYDDKAEQAISNVQNSMGAPDEDTEEEEPDDADEIEAELDAIDEDGDIDDDALEKEFSEDLEGEISQYLTFNIKLSQENQTVVKKGDVMSVIENANAEKAQFDNAKNLYADQYKQNMQNAATMEKTGPYTDGSSEYSEGLTRLKAGFTDIKNKQDEIDAQKQKIADMEAQIENIGNNYLENADAINEGTEKILADTDNIGDKASIEAELEELREQLKEKQLEYYRDFESAADDVRIPWVQNNIDPINERIAELMDAANVMGDKMSKAMGKKLENGYYEGITTLLDPIRLGIDKDSIEKKFSAVNEGVKAMKFAFATKPSLTPYVGDYEYNRFVKSPDWCTKDSDVINYFDGKELNADCIDFIFKKLANLAYWKEHITEVNKDGIAHYTDPSVGWHQLWMDIRERGLASDYEYQLKDYVDDYIKTNFEPDRQILNAADKYSFMFYPMVLNDDGKIVQSEEPEQRQAVVVDGSDWDNMQLNFSADLEKLLNFDLSGIYLEDDENAKKKAYDAFLGYLNNVKFDIENMRAMYGYYSDRNTFMEKYLLPMADGSDAEPPYNDKKYIDDIEGVISNFQALYQKIYWQIQYYEEDDEFYGSDRASYFINNIFDSISDFYGGNVQPLEKVEFEGYYDYDQVKMSFEEYFQQLYVGSFFELGKDTTGWFKRVQEDYERLPDEDKYVYVSPYEQVTYVAYDYTNYPNSPFNDIMRYVDLVSDITTSDKYAVKIKDKDNNVDTYSFYEGFTQNNMMIEEYFQLQDQLEEEKQKLAELQQELLKLEKTFDNAHYYNTLKWKGKVCTGAYLAENYKSYDEIIAAIDDYISAYNILDPVKDYRGDPDKFIKAANDINAQTREADTFNYIDHGYEHQDFVDTYGSEVTDSYLFLEQRGDQLYKDTAIAQYITTEEKAPTVDDSLPAEDYNTQVINLTIAQNFGNYTKSKLEKRSYDQYMVDCQTIYDTLLERNMFKMTTATDEDGNETQICDVTVETVQNALLEYLIDNFEIFQLYNYNEKGEVSATYSLEKQQQSGGVMNVQTEVSSETTTAVVYEKSYDAIADNFDDISDYTDVVIKSYADIMPIANAFLKGTGSLTEEQKLVYTPEYPGAEGDITSLYYKGYQVPCGKLDEMKTYLSNISTLITEKEKAAGKIKGAEDDGLEVTIKPDEYYLDLYEKKCTQADNLYKLVYDVAKADATNEDKQQYIDQYNNTEWDILDDVHVADDLSSVIDIKVQYITTSYKYITWNTALITDDKNSNISPEPYELYQMNSQFCVGVADNNGFIIPIGSQQDINVKSVNATMKEDIARLGEIKNVSYGSAKAKDGKLVDMLVFSGEKYFYYTAITTDGKSVALNMVDSDGNVTSDSKKAKGGMAGHVGTFACDTGDPHFMEYDHTRITGVNQLMMWTLDKGYVPYNMWLENNDASTIEEVADPFAWEESAKKDGTGTEITGSQGVKGAFFNSWSDIDGNVILLGFNDEDMRIETTEALTEPTTSDFVVNIEDPSEVTTEARREITDSDIYNAHLYVYKYATKPSKLPDGDEGGYKNWKGPDVTLFDAGIRLDGPFGRLLQPAVNFFTVIRAAVLGVVFALALLYAVYLGIKYAKASDDEKRREAKEHIKWFVLAVIIANLLIVLLYVASRQLSEWQDSVSPQTVETTEATTSDAVTTTKAMTKVDFDYAIGEEGPFNKIADKLIEFFVSTRGAVILVFYALALLFAIRLGVKYASAGNESKKHEAKEHIKWFIIGIIIAHIFIVLIYVGGRSLTSWSESDKTDLINSGTEPTTIEHHSIVVGSNKKSGSSSATGTTGTAGDADNKGTGG